MSFGPRQIAILDRVERIARSGAIAPPGILLVGPRGCGKRTIARGLADRLGSQLIRLILNEPANAVIVQLIGGPTEEGPSGWLGTDDPTVLYLDGFHALPAGELRILIQHLLTLRAYTAPDGNRYTLSPNLVILSGLRHPESDALLTPDAPICVDFRRVDVSVPDDEGELLGVANRMLDRLDPGRRIADGVGPVLREAARSADGLVRVEYWLREVVNADIAREPVSAAALESARDRDIQFHLDKIVFRGRRLKLDGFLRWQDQFPPELHSVTADLVRHISSRYYVSDTQYWDLLDRLLDAAGFRRRERVVYCLWQPYGKSGPAVMHDLKNRHELNPQPHLDVTVLPDGWPKLPDVPPPTFVFADDFIGTGGTICALWEEGTQPILQLLEAYPRSRVVILALAALDVGERRVRNSLEEAGINTRVDLAVGLQFGQSDRCLSTTSSIITDPAARTRLQRFCEEYRGGILPEKVRFGYENSQCLVVFPNSVPNNSLAILWYERKGWVPLLPASGRPDLPL